MTAFRFDRWLAGTAVAVVLTIPAMPAIAGTDSSSAIEAAVPVPPMVDLKPITPADVGGTPAAAPTPATESKAADTAPVADPVSDKIKEQFAAKVDKAFGSKKDRTAAESFYAARNYAPVWIEGGVLNERGKAAAAHLNKADAEGLDPAEYPTPYLKPGLDADAIADAELRLTASVLNFVRHEQIGRVHYSRVSADIVYNLEADDPGEVLGKLASSKNVDDTLAGFAPQNPLYQKLKAKLAEIRAAKGEAGPARIPSGPVLKITKNNKREDVLMQDPRVPLLRERLAVAGTADDLNYDRPLSDAVAKFQKQRGLAATGNLTAATVDAINGPKRDNIPDLIVANMERWRWLPRDLGEKRVILNIPDYTLRVYDGQAIVWQTRVVVGKPGTPTPLLSETMKYITVNPTWNVPPSIVYNEYLPAVQQDPTVLERMGLKLTQNADGSVHISQPPGERNALGRIRFNFPNKFLVYQHDTPDKHLFAQDKRAYSHGCMRVQDPAKYAEVILSLANPKDGYTQDKIKSMYGRSEIDIRLTQQIPVHITYQTAFVDDSGNLQIRDDIYGRDARLVAILKGDDRRNAEVAMERSQPNYSRPSVRLPPGVGGSFASGPSFFEMLFGGSRQDPPARNRRAGGPRTVTR